MQDLLEIQYSLVKTNTLATVNIFTLEGELISNVISGETLESKGVVLWNGMNESGSMVNMGIYIALVELYHSDGRKERFKLPFIVKRE